MAIPPATPRKRLRDLQTLNRATEVYLTQLMPVSEIALREGLRAFGATKPTQVVIWESLMDARTILLTANTETVYAISHLALGSDGPTVVEAPPHMLGFLQDGLQRYVADIGPLGPDKGQGGKFLVLPPGFKGSVPDGYFVSHSPTYSVTFAVRGFQVDGKTDQAVALMKQIKIYPLDEGVIAATDGVHERLPQRDRHPVPGQPPLLRTAGDAGRRRAVGEFRPAGTFDDAGHRHREGQAVRAGRDDEGALVGGGASRRRDGASQHLRLAGARRLLLPRSQMAGTSRTA